MRDLIVISDKPITHDSIADLVKDKKIEGISEIRDESDRKDRVRIVIELKRDANAQVVLNNLYKHTNFQVNYGIIFLVIDNGTPKTLSLKEIIEKVPEDYTVEFTICKNVFKFSDKVIFKFNSIIMMSRLINGTYPDTSKLIPTSFETTMKVKLNDICKTLNSKQ